MAKGAANLRMNKKPHKNEDAHASTPGMKFGDHNPDKDGGKRIKVAKGLMIKK